MSPRRAAVIGIIFVVIAAIYLVAPQLTQTYHVDFAGVTMLFALGAAMSIMAYVLLAGSRN